MVITNSWVVYDVLSVAINLEKYNGDFNFSEINLFCYFACLLSLYSGKPFSDWGYSFIKNERGVPVSAEISLSIQLFKDSGYLIETTEGYFNITKKGVDFHNQLTQLDRYIERTILIKNACDSLLLNSIGNVRSIINNEPMISATKNSSLRLITDNNSGTIDLLYNQFSILKHILSKEKTDDLFLVALTWLKCIQKIREFGYANK